jgi:hypothetical protein
MRRATALPVTFLLLGVAPLSHGKDPSLTCDYPTSKTERIALGPNDAKQCVDLRGGDTAEVLALNPNHRFATACPVEIEWVKVPLKNRETNCKPVDGALEVLDVMRIDEWSGGKFELSIRRPIASGAKTIVSSAPLTPVTLKLNSAGGGQRETTLGYYADVALDPTKPGELARYYVYLALAYDNAGHPIKSYGIEVFDRDAECIAEEPSQVNSQLIDCSPAPAAEVDRESPIGGGGEPPPRPRP